MAGEATAFPVTDDTTALYYFQGDSLAVSAGVDSGPNNFDLSVFTNAPTYGLDGYYADAAIEAGDDGVEFFDGGTQAGLVNENSGDVMFPAAGYQIEIIFYMHEWDGSNIRFSSVFNIHKTDTDYLRIFNDESNRKMQLDWEIGGTRAILRDANADSNHLNTWICVIIAYEKNGTGGVDSGPMMYSYGRLGIDANLHSVTDYQVGSAQNVLDWDNTTDLFFGFDNVNNWYSDYEKSLFHVKSIASLPSQAELDARYDNIVAGTGVGGGGPLIGGTLIGGRTGQLIGG